MPHPRFASEEIARRGQALYDERVRPQIEADHRGKVVVIDIETGDYEVDDDHMEAAERALAKRPEAALYAVRVGSRALTRIGAGAAVASSR